MNEWPFKVSPLTQNEITLAIKDEEWQYFRRSLKGKVTQLKLLRLSEYWDTQLRRNSGDAEQQRTIQVRVDNYINALLRGGQLVHRDGAIIVQR